MESKTNQSEALVVGELQGGSRVSAQPGVLGSDPDSKPVDENSGDSLSRGDLSMTVDELLEGVEIDDSNEFDVGDINAFLAGIEQERLEQERERERKYWETSLAAVQAERDRLAVDLLRERARVQALETRNADLAELVAELEGSRDEAMAASISRDFDTFAIAYEYAEEQIYADLAESEAEAPEATCTEVLELQRALEAERKKSAQFETAFYAQLTESAQLRERLCLTEEVLHRQALTTRVAPPAERMPALFAFKYTPPPKHTGDGRLDSNCSPEP